MLSESLTQGSGGFPVDYIILIMSYLLGSVPFGLVLTRLAGKGDIRQIGSGNIGATNVLRTGDKKLAALTLFLDAIKGVIAIIIARTFSDSELTPLLAGALAVLGHIFPVWLKFKGGKGVATTLAVLTAFYPPVGISVCVTWLIVFFVSRVSSLSAVLAMTAAPVIAFLFVEQTGFGTVYTTLLLSTIVVVRHASNIRRLLSGQEKQISLKKRK